LPDADYPKSWLGYQLGAISRWLYQKLGHRSFLHSLLAVSSLILVLYLIQGMVTGGSSSWQGAAAVGYGSHLLADMMTVGGVRLFWPSRVIAVFPGRDEYRVISGEGSERIFFVVALCAAILFYPLSQQGLERLLYGLRPSEELYVTIEEVIDGDTAQTKFGGQPKTIRLLGVDTPETVDPNRPQGCYGAEASDLTKRILEGQTVRIALPSLGDSTDAYGRMLVYVYIDLNEDGKDELFNLVLLRWGYAKTTNFDHEYRREFSSAEHEAAQKGLGLWGACPGEGPLSSGRLL
jgi:endonuclease YncB( thermonuclease family)